MSRHTPKRRAATPWDSVKIYWAIGGCALAIATILAVAINITSWGQM